MNLKKHDEVAFRVNPLGYGKVLGVGHIMVPGDRVSTITVDAVQKTPFLKEGQKLTLANTMLLPLSALSSCDSLAIIDA